MATRKHSGPLGKQLEKIAELKADELEYVAKTAFINTFNAVVNSSPVGNPDLWVTQDSDGNYVDYVAYRGQPEGYTGGQFRASWKLSDGMINYDTAEENSTFKPVFEEDDMKLLMSGTPYYFTNSLPYAERIEYGWSTQAPEGIVRIQLQRFNLRVGQIARHVK
jgi:hypothetical protein